RLTHWLSRRHCLGARERRTEESAQQQGASGPRAMLGSATRGGGGPSSATNKPPHAEGAVRGTGTTVVADAGQEVTVSQFIAQLDEAARRRLDGMHQRLRLLEQQMETLEAEVGKASGGSTMGTYA
ncbi:unnamed protein product, partial [Urochloa humidicola]